jgi:hypothetical protein
VSGALMALSPRLGRRAAWPAGRGPMGPGLPAGQGGVAGSLPTGRADGGVEKNDSAVVLSRRWGAPVGGGGLRVNLWHGEAKGELSDNPIEGGRSTGASSPEQQQWLQTR